MNPELLKLLERTFFRARRHAVIYGLVLLGYAAGVEVLRLFVSPFDGLMELPSNAYAVLRYGFLFVVLFAVIALPYLRGMILHRGGKISMAEAPAAEVAGRLYRRFLVTIAVVDLPGFLGLVLFLISGNWITFYGFWLASLIFFGLYFPRYERWVAALEGE